MVYPVFFNVFSLYFFNCFKGNCNRKLYYSRVGFRHLSLNLIKYKDIIEKKENDVCLCLSFARDVLQMALGQFGERESK